MKNKIGLEDIGVENQDFWMSFFHLSYPNAFDEEADVSLSELIDDLGTANIEWWSAFTGYDEVCFDETDGYAESPTTLTALLPAGEVLRIEFHPGDILYFTHDEQIGSTGPHWKLQVIPYQKVEELLEQENGVLLFFLLLPLAFVEREEVPWAKTKIQSLLSLFFPQEVVETIVQCILHGLLKEYIVEDSKTIQ